MIVEMFEFNDWEWYDHEREGIERFNTSSFHMSDGGIYCRLTVTESEKSTLFDTLSFMLPIRSWETAGTKH